MPAETEHCVESHTHSEVDQYHTVSELPTKMVNFLQLEIVMLISCSWPYVINDAWAE